MFLIFKDFKYNEIIDFLVEDYGLEKEKTEKIVNDFIRSYKCTKLIKDKLERLNFKLYGDYELV